MAVLRKAASVPLFIAGCVLFYFGSGMLFLVPGDPGENYWKSVINGRFLYGVIPFVMSLGAFAAVGWLWTRPGDHLRKSIKRAFLLGSAAVALFWLGPVILADIRQGS